MTILVTGAAGFIAEHLVSELRRRSDERIIGVDIRPIGDGRADERLTADLTIPNAARDVLERAKPRLVFHLAGASSGSAQEIHATNVNSMRALVDAVRVCAPRARVLAVGSAAEYGRVPIDSQPVSESFVGKPESAYGAAKVAVTRIAQRAAADGQTICIARPFNVIGPGIPDGLVGGAIIRRIRDALAASRETITIGRTDAIRDFIDVRDVARAFVEIAERGGAGEAYNVCTGKGHSVQQLLALLLTFAPRPLMAVADDALMRHGDVDGLVGSPAKVQRQLDWSARMRFDDSVRAMWEHSAN